jgi:tetratricopeptide (TPR) repeat protein
LILEKSDVLKARGIDRTNAFIAALVFLISFLVYYSTKAPTFSFWDCGEFVASAYILGIPHPPGSPLYVLLGRIFSVLPIAADISVRVNLLSVFASAGAALFGYLVIVRFLRFWFPDRNDIKNKIMTYAGGFTGALFMAFSNTNWSNAVEAEVYAPAILLMMIIYWLTLRYLETRETPKGFKILLLIPYLALLGVGIHLAMYVVAPIMALYFILKKEAGSGDWGIIAVFFLLELFLIFQLSSRPKEIPFFLPIAVVFAVFLFHQTLLPKISRMTFITMGIFLISLYPLYLAIIGSLAKNVFGRDMTMSLAVLKDLPIGWIGLAALTGWGIYCATKSLSERTKERLNREWFGLAVYSVSPAILILIGLIFRGYEAFIALTAISIATLGLILRRYINWTILIAIGSISMIILGFWQFVYGIIVGAALIIGLGLFLKERVWKIALAILLMGSIGYSIHAFIPIRSAQNPAIDENKPSSSLAAMVGYLERKQYGSQSMTERMFVRRGEWENQFGDYQRMGFWRFFEEQYGFQGPRFFVVLLIGLFGLWEGVRRKPEIGLPFLILLLVCSVGIVLYMNFADGTRQDPVTGQDYLEVRNRDYFFTPAFVLFGLAIGLGIAAVMDFIRDLAKTMKPIFQKSIFGASGLLILLPLFPLKANYHINDRSRNFMSYDYAYNYLIACEKDAILFTNGDNDTFPLWCLQQVYGFRKDVRVVNLSLANTHWYIRQLRDRMEIPLDLNDAQISALRAYMGKDGEGVRVQDQIVEQVISSNRWRYPIYITATVPSQSRRFRGRSLEENLSLCGLAYRLFPSRAPGRVDIDKSRSLFFEQYKYRGLDDPSVYKDENALRIVGNYANGILFLADSLSRAGDLSGAQEIIRKGLEIIPDSYDLHAFGLQILADMGQFDALQSYVESAPVREKWKLYLNWGVAARLAGRTDEAVRIFELTHRLFPEYADAYKGLATLYYQTKNFSKLRRLVADWAGRHPDDAESRQFLREIKNVPEDLDTAQGIK